MSHVQEVQHRLLFEQLEQWVDKLDSEEPMDRAVLEELVMAAGGSGCVAAATWGEQARAM
ncbi:MAG TPA: hypothetical protein VGO16_04280 [Pseudonocardiaceae bacterium]|nr:hypothetical protein [Pseudonocardiaceae bacterium]